uniref:Uncharacterized protein n=1 Tax=Panagrellus redivivus TaxID=6233 RepID=A0A7E4WAQ7_PANRE
MPSGVSQVGITYSVLNDQGFRSTVHRLHLCQRRVSCRRAWHYRNQLVTLPMIKLLSSLMRQLHTCPSPWLSMMLPYHRPSRRSRICAPVAKKSCLST